MSCRQERQKLHDQIFVRINKCGVAEKNGDIDIFKTFYTILFVILGSNSIISLNSVNGYFFTLTNIVACCIICGIEACIVKLSYTHTVP